MDKFQMLSNSVEELEKELWALVKKSLPSLKQELVSLISQGTTTEAIKSAVSSFLDDLLSSQQTIQDIKNRLRNLEIANTDMQEEVDDLTNTTTGHTSLISDLSSLLESTRASLTSVAQRVSANEEGLIDLETDLSSLSGQVEVVDSLLESTRASLTSVAQRVTDCEEDISSANTTLGTLSTTLESTKASLTSVAQRMTTAEEDIDDLQSTTSSHASTISTLQTNVDSLESQISSLDSDLSSLSTDLGSLDTTLESTRASLTSVAQRVTTCENNISAADSEIDDLSTTLESTKASLTSISQRMNTCESKVSTCENIVNGVDDEISSLSSTLESTRASLTSVAQRVTACEEEIDSLAGGSGGGETVDVLYDKDDPNKNSNAPNGMTGSKSLVFDYAKYKKLRIYANVKSYYAYTEMPLHGSISDGVVLSTDATGLNCYLVHLRATEAQNRFAVFYTIILSRSSGSVTMSSVYYQDADIYVYRVEGVY